MKSMIRTISVCLLIAALLLTVSIAEGQQAKKIPRIGFLSGGSPASFSVFIEAFRQGLSELGYVEEKNITIEYRWAEGANDRLTDFALELVRLKVDVIVTSGGTTTIFAARMQPRESPSSWRVVAILLRPGLSKA